MFNGFFHRWCIHVIPLIYDDSLSLYECVGKLYKQVEILRQALSETQSNVETNAANIAALDEKVSGIDTRLSKAETDIVNINDDIKNLNTALGTLSARVTKNETDIETINSTISSINSEIENINGIIDAHTSSISAINDSIGTINTKITTLQSATQTNTNDIENLKSTTADNTNDIENLKSTTADNTNDISLLKTTTATHSTDINNLKTASQTQTTDINNLKTASQEQATNINNLNTELQSVSGEVATNSTDIAALQQSNENGASKLNHDVRIGFDTSDLSANSLIKPIKSYRASPTNTTASSVSMLTGVKIPSNIDIPKIYCTGCITLVNNSTVNTSAYFTITHDTGIDCVSLTNPFDDIPDVTSIKAVTLTNTNTNEYQIGIAAFGNLGQIMRIYVDIFSLEISTPETMSNNVDNIISPILDITGQTTTDISFNINDSSIPQNLLNTIEWFQIGSSSSSTLNEVLSISIDNSNIPDTDEKRLEYFVSISMIYNYKQYDVSIHFASYNDWRDGWSINSGVSIDKAIPDASFYHTADGTPPNNTTLKFYTSKEIMVKLNYVTAEYDTTRYIPTYTFNRGTGYINKPTTATWGVTYFDIEYKGIIPSNNNTTYSLILPYAPMSIKGIYYDDYVPKNFEIQLYNDNAYITESFKTKHDIKIYSGNYRYYLQYPALNNPKGFITDMFVSQPPVPTEPPIQTKAGANGTLTEVLITTI